MEYGSEEGRKLALLGATSLYLDFVNLFLFLLRLLGRRGLRQRCQKHITHPKRKGGPSWAAFFLGSEWRLADQRTIKRCDQRPRPLISKVMTYAPEGRAAASTKCLLVPAGSLPFKEDGHPRALPHHAWPSALRPIDSAPQGCR